MSKFVTVRELAFISRVTKELPQHVNMFVVHYYAVSVPETKVHRLYNEAVQKTWAAPVHCNAQVLYDNPQTQTTGMPPDSVYTVEVYFHKDELTDRNVSPKEGDFMEFGQIFFEITSVTMPQLVYGMVQ